MGQCIFWASVAGAVAAYYKYKTASTLSKQIGINMSETNKNENETQTPTATTTEHLGTENMKKVLTGFNALGEEIATVAKDGIQVKDAATIASDLLTKPEFRQKLEDMIKAFPKAVQEAKNLDLMEGLDIAKFEYDGAKKIIDIAKS